MANDDNIRARGGLLPVEYPFGNFKKQYWRLSTAAGTAANDGIYIGMPADLGTDGRITVGVNLAGSSTTLIGSIVGFADTSLAAIPSTMETTTAAPFLPGNTDAYVLVACDVNQLFVVQEDTGGSALAETNIGNAGILVYRSTSGDSVTGYATAELDRSLVSTSTALQLFLVNVATNKNSDGTTNAPGNYCKWIVKISNHRLDNCIAQFQGGSPI